ncbi:MAG: DUF4194 domain-containing protein [Chitinophagaceae bacterium]|nr:MAG: DUF4194 domain-containing protein [Chitinophagaceae bacterium]
MEPIGDYKTLPYASVLARLLKGPVEYLDKTYWETLLQYQMQLNSFLLQLGLKLILEKDDGYAFVEQVKDDAGDPVVSWMHRRTLTYDESVLLILLRSLMADFEMGEITSRELIKKRRELKDAAEDFFKENASRVRFIRDLDKLIDRVCELGFLEKWEEAELLDEQRFRIKKWIKQRVDNEVLEDFRKRLTSFQQSALDESASTEA